MRYLSVNEIAKKWNISERSVRNYCAQGRVNGAFLTGKTWNIPEDAKKPERSNKRKEQPTLLDILQEEKKENLTNTFNALLEMGVIPIVNENDSVSYTEIESEDRLFGDNDMLSSVVAVLCRAKRLVILSDIDGFYDSDPRLYPNAKLIEQIDTIDESVYSLAGGAGSRRGTGGMRTKLQAAQLATSQGIDTIVTNGKRPEALYDIVRGGKAGTLFTGKM